MYANAPHASATTPPVSPHPQHQLAPQAQVQQHVHPHGMPPASSGGSHGMNSGYMTAPVHAVAHRAPVSATAFVTGAYQPSGDAAIDRMLRLEAACKRFGSPV